MTKKLVILKTFLLIMFSGITAFSRNTVLLAVIFLLSLVLNKVIGFKRETRVRLKPLLFMSVLIFIFQIFFNTQLDIQYRILEAVTSSLRIVDLSLLVFMYTSTTSPSLIISTFSFLPEKVRLLITFTFSMIPWIISETGKIIAAQNSRGLNTKGLNIFNSFIPIIIPVLHRTLQKAEHLSIILYSRGYDN